MRMKKIILIILVVLIGLSVGGFFIWKNISAPKVKYKGIWMPTLIFQDPNYLASNIQKLKDLGVNAIFIVGVPPQSELWIEKAKAVFPPELAERIEETIPSQKEIIIDNIQTAHRNGLKVGLTIVNPPPEMKDLLDVELLNSKIIEYARLAEEYDVELFAPMGEPEQIFGERIGEWRQEILPRVKEVYHGEIVWKGTGVGLLPDKATIAQIPEQPPGDFVGYDYIGFSTMHIPRGSLTPEERLQFANRLTLEDYSKHVEGALDYKLAQSERDNCKGIIITEFGVGRGGSWSEEEIARAHEIVLEKGKGRVVGFFVNSDFLGEDLPGWFIEEDLKTEEVIRRYFREIL